MDIPTADDFLASKDVISDDDPVNNRSRTATVKRIGPYVMKYNGRTCLQEADNLAYIAAYTKIPVPKCYASGIVPNSELNGKYLIMDFIEGDTLQKLWPDLSRVDKDNILQQLHGYIAEYRSLPPPDYLGAVVKGPLAHQFFKYAQFFPGRGFGGPFPNAQAFNDAAAARLGIRMPKQANRVALLTMQMNEVLKDYRTVFTHTDLQPKNIIVQKQGRNEDGSGVFKVTIIDWEDSGWYPEWWEWCQASFWFTRMQDDFPLEVPKIMPVYPVEFFCWEHIHHMIGDH